MTSPEKPDDGTFQAEGDADKNSVQKPSIDDAVEKDISKAEQEAFDAFSRGDEEKLRKKYLLQRFWH
jgi:hypothetical protein